MGIRVTVFTSTFNRENTLYRVYDSLVKQTFKDFEWIIVDNGSTDNTKTLVNSYIEKADFPIIYKYQENLGRHIAINRGVETARGELFITADSDDAFEVNSLEVLVNEWDKIHKEERSEFKGVTCRCIDGDSGKPLGKEFFKEPLDSNDLEIVLKYKFDYEMWGILSTEVLRKYPFPEIKGLNFFPETVIWQAIARSYKTRYINIPLRYYYRDQANALTNLKSFRTKENIYLWVNHINNNFDYFKYDVLSFVKAFLGLSRDGLLLRMKCKQIISCCKDIKGKVGCIMFFPMGTVLYLIRRKRFNKMYPEIKKDDIEQINIYKNIM